MNYIAELETEKAFSDIMRDAADMWKARAESAEREKLLVEMALVKAAGGEIEVGVEDLYDLPNLTLVRTENPANHSIRYKIVPTPSAGEQ